MAMASFAASTTLPPSLVARILSYNVASTRDVARLREVSRSEGQLAVTMLPSLISKAGGQWIQPPSRKTPKPFAMEFPRLPEDTYDEHLANIGDLFEFHTNHDASFAIFDKMVPVKMRIIDMPRPLNPSKQKEVKGKERAAKRAKIAKTQSKDDFLSKLSEVCAGIENVQSIKQLQDIANEVKTYSLLNANVGIHPPVGKKQNIPKSGTDIKDATLFVVMLTLRIKSDAKCIRSRFLSGNEEFLEIETSGENELDGFNPIPARYPGRTYFARVVSSSPDSQTLTVQVIVELITDLNDIEEVLSDTQVSLLYSDYMKRNQENYSMVEGVAIVDGAIENSLQDLLTTQINSIAKKQEENNAVDYHPNSKNIVRDLIHPGIYSYVGGVTKVEGSVKDEQPFVFPALDGKEKPAQNEGQDFWGRQYETSKYQWLPTYFSISREGRCTIEDYINNLTPRDDPVCSELYDSFARLFEAALPYVESVFSYVQAVRPNLRQHGDNVKANLSPLNPLDMAYVPLRGQKLQVITKVVDYELHPQQRHEGVWHVEGMSHEEIVLTCLYVLDRDDCIQGGELEFKRAFLRDEANYVYGSVRQVRASSLDSIVTEGLVPLGRVDTRKGRLLVFPNSHVHRVCEMINSMKDGSVDAGVKRRRIVVFWLVNPQRRIVSTREVSPQQVHSGGSMSHDDALAYRLELMKERKMTKQDWNVRDIELCEH